MSYIAVQPNKKAPAKPLNPFDVLVLVVSFVYPLSALPQAIGVFQGNTQGVSALSWFFFLYVRRYFLYMGYEGRCCR